MGCCTYGLPMWKAFLRYRKLDPEARKLFWRAAVLLPLAAASLRLRGFQRTKGKLGKKLAGAKEGSPARQGDAAAVEKTCRMVKAGARYGLGHPTCLEQSLVLWYLLESQNIPARFCIGVKKTDEKFEAHAWVEHAGAALNQPGEMHQHYAAFESEFSELPGEKA
jgi:Transglutaminase-like superfamily